MINTRQVRGAKRKSGYTTMQNHPLEQSLLAVYIFIYIYICVCMYIYIVWKSVISSLLQSPTVVRLPEATTWRKQTCDPTLF